MKITTQSTEDSAQLDAHNHMKNCDCVGTVTRVIEKKRIKSQDIRRAQARQMTERAKDERKESALCFWKTIESRYRLLTGL